MLEQLYGAIQLAQTPLPTPQVAALEQRLRFNGETWVGAWRQWRDTQGRLRIALSDPDAQRLGMGFRSSRRPQEQPLVWFSPVQNVPVSWQTQQTRRYLDVTELFAAAGWQTQTQGNELRITAPVARIQAIRQSSRRTVIDLDQPAPWTVQTTGKQTILRVLAPGRAELRQQFANLNFSAQAVVLTFNQPLRVTTLPDPPRLVIEPRSPEKLSIEWAPGLRWRQEQRRGYGVTWLEIDPQKYTMRPVWEGSRGQTGLAVLSALAQQAQGVAAINGGFFNRNTQLPLGAIRVQGQWHSSPILNRGMAGWNDQGQMVFARAQLQEQLRLNQGAPVNLQALNSGYVQKGLARYTANWGATYTPLTQGETVITIAQNQVVGMVATGNPVPIPLSGYLLVGRGLGSLGQQFPTGATVQISEQLTPRTMQNYPHGLGAGPLLLDNGRVVLAPEQEQFQPFFSQQKAPRSALGVTRSGQWLWVTVGGNEQYQQGPTLMELSRIMQEVGAVAALNLDGGTSTSLVLGAQVLVAGGRVHNGLVLRRR
ncbi:Exopolysaccharide biosynthesis protein related to N-acetylglucosamine-1-phosphodiester alpha-N-acetylglucosaminidase [Gloeomargarita lithophora Alchichica-D10]|uniref:Exopolysaccharide biosynthesis protein related to N-acetylglucosamine-1-phosphodiester alpha-N-acetylglucosaminidase n=1 Tax=Gloeomargarita lithophora Alchichica-D10 TaxID=1188229 RepID=A0A1J0AEC0_9CYAN|nr:phosphodiester glycosidase family protein [Gloeomargarita lithophora]APB34243.1 Exopolysaccharide biosynthesis protein related to N-acetylglucosamine-1-phosphodiester alpha-N-acetylglucosaminidase [Gloeomargarita lithophora Alchichica-D10]